MSYNICKVKNIDSVSHTYNGQVISAGGTYVIQDGERISWATLSDLLADITNDKAQIGDGTNYFTDYSDQIDWLKDAAPKKVQQVTPANEHELTPIGMGKKHISNSSYCGTLTLSGKSGDTFSYSVATFTPTVGCILTEDEYQTMATITAVDTGAGTLTVDDATNLSNGTLRYMTKPIDLQYKLPTITKEGVLPYHMLWGVRVGTMDTHNENDFGRAQIVDVDGVGVSFGWYTQAEFDAMGEYVVSDYDKTWMQFFKAEPLFRIPDNSPGPVPPGLYFRLKYYVTQLTGTTKVWWDYLTTVKDA